MELRRRERVEYVGVMQSKWKRVRLWTHILAMRIVAWIVLIAGGGFHEEFLKDDDVAGERESESESEATGGKGAELRDRSAIKVEVRI